MLFIVGQVCSEWRNIALTMRDTVFGENDDQLIDIHDVKVFLGILLDPDRIPKAVTINSTYFIILY